MLDRTTNATGPVVARTAAELARVDAGWHFRDANDYPFRGQGLGVPTLREVLTRHRGVPIIIEMKIDSAEMGRRVAADVIAAGAEQWACAAGYGGLSAEAARAAIPSLATSATYDEV